MINAFSVDVEDYFQVSGFESCICRDSWNSFESRVTSNTHRILNLLDTHHVRATFFVLGWIANKHPGLVREISDRGHEVGSHSYWHRLVYHQSVAEFRDDLRRSRDVLESILGTKVTSYRAPSFSITQRSKWALDILVQEGFRIDSSIFPIHHDRYGMPGARRDLHRLTTPSGELWEFPPAVAHSGTLNLPVGGGGYFRLFPFEWTSYWLSHIQRRDCQPTMFYIHPWEIDPSQPRLHVGGWLMRFRHYVNLARTEEKLDRLLQRFHFGSCSDALNAQLRETRKLCAVETSA
jgi:polysaccharide deacetylase family protein (PEP-CTERM system associated)